MADTLEKILKSAVLAQKAKQNIRKAIYPTNIVVDLNGPDGNVYAVIGICNEAAQKLQLDNDEILKFNEEVLAQKQYEDILNICQRWFGLIYIKNYLNKGLFLRGELILICLYQNGLINIESCLN